MKIIVYKNSSWLHVAAVTLAIVASICFYNLKTMNLYIGISFLSMAFSIIATYREHNLKILQENGVKYLTILYIVFTIYGTMFLRAGDYNWDRLIFTYIQEVCLYCSFRYFFSFPNWCKKITLPFVLGAAFSILYMFTLQQEQIFMAQVEERLGGDMSGNVNTVGYSLGIVSFVVVYYYCITKEKIVFFVLLPLFFMMLLTGSKKTFIIIVIDIFTLYVYGKAKVSSFVKLAFFASILLWAVFESNYFYEVIGKRIEDMYTTLTGTGGGDYSHSTEDRSGMISEALRLGFNNPLFGGGMNYFEATSKNYGYYGYSHCNYTELFCNFGLFGLLLYYIPYIKNIFYFWKNKKKDWQKTIFVVMWLVTSLALGWLMVAFSDICMSYLPIIASFAMLESSKVQFAIKRIKSKPSKY